MTMMRESVLRGLRSTSSLLTHTHTQCQTRGMAEVNLPGKNPAPAWGSPMPVRPGMSEVPEYLPHRTEGGRVAWNKDVQADLPFKLTGIHKLLENTTFLYPNKVPLNAEGLHKWRPGCGTLRWWHGLFGEYTTNRFTPNTKMVIVDGPIGAGKSQLCKELADRLHMRYFPEISNQWFQETMHDGQRETDWINTWFTDLDKFYDDPKAVCGHSSRLQWLLTCFRFYQYIDCLLHMMGTGQGVVLERSPYSNWAFKDALLAQGYMTPQFHSWMGELERMAFPNLLAPHLLIYLDISPEESYKRIQDRGAPSEKKVDPEYLKQLDIAYKRHLPKLNEKFGTVTVQYDWNKFGDVQQIIEDFDLLDFSDVQPWKSMSDFDYYRMRLIYQNKKTCAMWFDHPRLMPELTMHSTYGETFRQWETDLGAKKGYDSARWYHKDCIPKQWL